MTSPIKRRVRKLKVNRPAARRRVFIFGYPGQPDPDHAEIGPNDYVLKLRFVTAKNGRSVEGGSDASH